MSSPETKRRSPYQGLIPYSEQDAPFFFGREKETRLITANLFASPLTLLYGASGVGKSSVLRAGVAHDLRDRKDLLVVVFNLWQGNSVSALVQAIADQAKLADPAAWAAAMRLLPRDSEATLGEVLTICAAQLKRRLMIILDQFEEYFLYHPLEDEFATEFSRAVTQSDAPVSFLISIREDFYAKLDRFEGRIPALYENYLRIEHLDRKAARIAIEKPIAEYNHRYAANGQFTIEPELVTAVLRQVETGQVIIGEAGRGVIEAAKPHEDAEAQIETPFLQLVMTRLWETELDESSQRLRLETLNRLGGAENIVRTHLDAVISKLTSPEQEIAANIFHYLVTPSGTKIAYTASDLAGSAELNEAEVLRVLEKLSHGDVRILRPVDAPLDRPGAPPRYEIFHDVLAPAILTWRTAYVQAREREDAERQLALEAEERVRAEKQLARERSLARRLRWALVGLAFLLLAMTGLTTYAFRQRSTATKATTKAEKLQKEAEQQRFNAESARVGEAAQRAHAVEQKDRAEQALVDTKRAQGEAEKQKNRAEQALITVKGAQAQLVEQRNRAEQARAEAVKQRDIAKQAQGEALSAADAADAAAREAGRQRLMADEQRKVAQSRELAASALAQLPFDLDLSVLLARKAAEISPTTQAEEALRRALLDSHKRFVLSGDTDSVNSAAFSPDVKYIVTATDKSARVWDAKTGESVTELPKLSGPEQTIAFSPNGKFVVVTGQVTQGLGNRVISQMWQVGTWRSLTIPQSGDDERLIEVLSPDGSLVVTIVTRAAMYRGNKHWVASDTATVYETGQRKVVAELKAPTDPHSTNSIVSAVFTPDSKYVVVTSSYQSHIWEARTGRSVAVLQDKDEQVNDAYLSPDGKYVVTTGAAGVKSWDASTGRKINEWQGQYDRIFADAFSRDDNIIVITKSEDSNGEKMLLVWQASTGHIAKTKLPPYVTVQEASFSPDGKFVLVMDSYSLWIWDITGDNLRKLQSSERALRVAFSPDSKLVLTIDQNRTVQVWEAESGRSVGDPLKHLDPVDTAIFSPNSKLIVTTSRDDIARVWEAASGKQMAELRGHKGHLNSVAFSPDGRSVLTTSEDRTARVWEVGMAQSLCELRDIQYGLTGADNNTAQMCAAGAGPRSSEQRGPKGPVHSAAVSPDGKRAVLATDDSAVRVWDVLTSRNVAELRGHTQHVQSIAFSPDGKYLLTASNDNTARVWETSTGRTLVVLKDPTNRIESAAFSADGKSIVTISGQRWVQVWETSTGNKLAVLSPEAQREAVQAVLFSPDGRFVLTTNVYDALLWDLAAATGEGKVVAQPIKVLHDEPNHSDDRPVSSATFSPDGKFVVVTGGKVTQVWQVNPARALFVLQGQQDRISRAEFSPDGKLIVTAGRDKMARVWDAGTGQLLKQLSGHTGTVLSATFSPDGKFIVTASDDKTERVWAVGTGQTVAVRQDHGSTANAVFSFDGKFILTIDGAVESGNTASVWEAHTGQNVAVFRGGVAAISPDGKLVVTASQDDTAWVWETGTGLTIAELRGHKGRVTSTAFSPDNKLVATGSLEGPAWVWDVETGRQVAELRGHTGGVKGLMFSPDSKFVVTYSGFAYKEGRAGEDDNTARVWEASTGRNVAIMKGHEGWLNSAVFSPDGRYVVTTSGDKTARVWEASTGHERAVLNGHTAKVVAAVFSHDGKHVVTASYDKTARVWEASTGKLISELLGHRGEVNSAAFSFNDKFVVTASEDRTARIWEASTGQNVAELLGHRGEVDRAVFSPDDKLVITWSDAARVFACEVCGSLEDLKQLANRLVKRDLRPDEEEKYLHVPQKR